MVGEMAEQPSPDRTHDETDREQDSRVQLLDDRIVAGEERGREIERECRIGIKVVPLDQVPDRTDEDRLEATAYIGELKMVVSTDSRHRHRIVSTRFLHAAN